MLHFKVEFLWVWFIFGDWQTHCPVGSTQHLSHLISHIKSRQTPGKTELLLRAVCSSKEQYSFKDIATTKWSSSSGKFMMDKHKYNYFWNLEKLSLVLVADFFPSNLSSSFESRRKHILPMPLLLDSFFWEDYFFITSKHLSANFSIKGSLFIVSVNLHILLSLFWLCFCYHSRQSEGRGTRFGAGTSK